MCKLPYCKMTVRIIFLLSAFLLPATDATAQVKLGVVAGYGKSSLTKIQGPTSDINKYSGTPFFSGGLTGSFPFGQHGFGFNLSAIYNKKGYDFKLLNSSGASNTLKDSGFMQRLNYVDIGLQLQKRFSLDDRAGFFIGVGPALNVLVSGKEQITKSYFGSTMPSTSITKTKLETGNAAGQYKRMFPSLGFVIGGEFGRFSLSANYNLPLDYYYLDARKKYQHSMRSFGVSAGFTILRGKQADREKKERIPREPKEKPVKIEPVKIDSLADTDGDGITDIKDKCPGHKGTAKYGGCPVPDTDGDGVNDDADKCPLVEGVVTNYGCPEFKEPEIPVSKDTMRFTIYFEQAKSELKTNGFNTLSQVVKLMKANPRLVAQFNGHTDTHGSVEANSIRAFSRASVCADYVASFFIERKRLVVAAYSNKAPVADLKDPSVQWKNRRVEVLLFEK